MAEALLRRLTGFISIVLLMVSALTLIVPAHVSADYPGGDCDTNAVLRCGFNSTVELKADYRANQGGDTKAIFAHFGMKNEVALDNMVRGRVTKSGEIWVGNTKLATGAVTAGRIRMGSDEAKVPGANAWMRPPSRSFRSNSLEAFIKRNSRGEFVYGVIMSCGNPVQAQHKIKFPPKPKPQPPKPQPQKPQLEIKKDVRVLGDSGWQQEVAANPGDQLQYLIAVTNTGDVDLKNVRIQDSLPEGVSFQEEQIELLPTATNLSFPLSELVGEGVNIGTIPKGEVREITFVVTIGEEVDACDEKLRNVVHAEADDVPDEEGDALAKVCQPEEEEEQPPQVQGRQTPPKAMPVTGAAGTIGVFSITSFLGWAAYKLKEFYSTILR
jgi:uncharacterized repeat protein (TIGR01451 family)